MQRGFPTNSSEPQKHYVSNVEFLTRVARKLGLTVDGSPGGRGGQLLHGDLSSLVGLLSGRSGQERVAAVEPAGADVFEEVDDGNRVLAGVGFFGGLPGDPGLAEHAECDGVV